MCLGRELAFLSVHFPSGTDIFSLLMLFKIFPNRIFLPEDMELSANELSIYDKLSETIDLVRQTGYQCGMSEKAIEKFIRQLLEKNEPQRGPPRYPLLMFLYKGLVTLGLVLLTAYFMIQPHTLSVPETTLSRAHVWGSLMNHIRLLPLPITKKYMLEKCQDWLNLDCRQNASLPANCSCCCSVKNLVVGADQGLLSEKFLQLQPFFIKTGQHRPFAEIKYFQYLYPELTNFVIQEDSFERWRNHPRQRLPFQMFRQKSLNKTQILQELFPIFSSLLYPKSVSLENCFLIHHPRLQDKTYRLQNVFVVGSGQLTLNVVPSSLCRTHCETLMVELEAGDIGFANMDYWSTSFSSKGSEPTVVCDGSVS
ncbi:bombesin receptor-activated protein C6orf89 homolog isoform X2 [Anolis carolinensis]|uniref:bombesin receptor-activated protein C6orf89 homolog isoform X2 n=2 Tax=Anolis carolinensis TaxID=28377 RepID=UPI002F2B56CF